MVRFVISHFKAYTMQARYIKYILLLFIITSGSGAFAQIDNPMGGLAIPKSNTTIPAVAPKAKADAPTKKDEPRKSFSSYDLQRTDDNVSKNESFADRGEEFRSKINQSISPRGESNAAFRGNQNFGELRTKSGHLDILAADFGLEDGDRIRVLVNDRVVIQEFTLTNFNRGLQITLQPGFNKIDFEAMNQGTSGPNTAQFAIYDDSDKLLMSNQWNLATGFRASVMVIKE